MIFFNAFSKNKPTTSHTSMPIAAPVNHKINFPYDIPQLAEYSIPFQNIISNKSLVEGVDYVTVERTGLDSYHYSYGPKYSVKDKNIFDMVIAEGDRITYVCQCLDGYDARITSMYYSETFAIKNKLNFNIDFVPKYNKLSDAVRTIIGFYIKNQYDLPDANVFKDKLLTKNEVGRCFTVYVRDEEEAAALMLELSEYIDIV